MIEVRHLKLIETIAEVGSLNKAAKRLNLSPSALSHQLKQLESHLDLPLFYRSNNQLLFTPAGKEFQETAATILQQIDGLEERIDDIRQSQLEKYIHGYSQQEATRLYDQATSIADFLHWDTNWEAGSTILEAGCGVGAQTQIIAAQNPDCTFVSVDISKKSITAAERNIAAAELTNVRFAEADLRQLPYAANTFDHVFVCFVLEHLREPLQILKELRRVLKTGGTITVIEGDHGSTYFHPDSLVAQKAVQAQVDLQRQNGGNANIGRELYPLLQQADFQLINVSPRQIYVDDSKPALVDGFINKTFTAMIAGVAEDAVAKKLIGDEAMQNGIRDLHRTAQGGGTFCYTFFKAKATKEK
ncbi:MAG: methyltransferase domain-containing protein [Saprospiraceae bacterium]